MVELLRGLWLIIDGVGDWYVLMSQLIKCRGVVEEGNSLRLRLPIRLRSAGILPDRATGARFFDRQRMVVLTQWDNICIFSLPKF
jgi:hypothetical protein